MTGFGAYCFEVFDDFVGTATVKEESGTLGKPANKSQIYGIGDPSIGLLWLRSLIPRGLGSATEYGKKFSDPTRHTGVKITDNLYAIHRMP